MIGEAMVITIMSLWEKYQNKSKIAEIVGHDWKTVAKVIKADGKHEKKAHPRILDNHKEQVVKWLEESLTGTRIFEKLQALGVKISYSAVKRFIQDIKQREVFVRIETKPGEEAQVDFGYAGLILDNNHKKRKTWVFNMRLSYSRLDYFEKVYDQRVETFIKCHINAFKYFNGIPEYVKIDNLKAAILEANFYEPVYQHLYKAFADYYGFKPLPCRVRKPNDKGKVESGIKYVKNNFFLGRDFKDETDLNNQLRNWLDNTCNKRIHGTTKQIPLDLFNQEEKGKLKPLPLAEFKIANVGTRKVYHDCHIYMEHNYYSVPFEYVGKEVEIEITSRAVKIFYQGKEIALHIRQEGQGKFSTNPSHYPEYKRINETAYQEKYQSKMAEIGRFSEQFFLLAIDKHPKDWSRLIQGVLSLLKDYSKEIVEKACQRALAFNVCQYKVIKNICENGSYNLPVESNFTKEEALA